MIKYAYLVFNLPYPFPHTFKSFSFDAKTQLLRTTLKEQIEGPESKHWSEWLGSLTWDVLSDNNLVLSTWMETETAAISNQENIDLVQKLLSIFRVLPLAAPLRTPDEAFVFSGQGTHTAHGLSAKDIRTFTNVDCWTNSFYCSKEGWDEFANWADTHLNESEILNSWKICYEHYHNYFVVEKKRRQLIESYRSFEEAMKGTQLEFKIPNLVRAIECIVDCYGAKDFADKVIYLIGTPLQTLPFSVSSSTKDLLEDLYQLRNDCSHGKHFAYSYQKKFAKLPDEITVAKYEFLAEWAARKILVDAFNKSSIHSYTEDRDILIDAWKKKLIQP